MTGLRGIIAERLTQSWRERPHVTLTTEADATNLVAAREQLNVELASRGEKISYNALLIKLVAQALHEQPNVNVQLAASGLQTMPEINIGLAVDTERGLLVPVVHGALEKSLRALAAAGLFLVASCAVLPASRLATPPDPATVQSRLLQDEADTRTVTGFARVAFEAPLGSGSGSHVIVVVLPDRARVEALTPLGTTALVATVGGDALRAHSPVRDEYWTGRATRETLGRLLNLPIPPDLLLRVLAGLPPLPVRADDPRFMMVPEGPAVRVESVDGELWQRLWTEPDDPAVGRGEVGRASEALLSFAFADRRPTDGRDFPFEMRIEEMATRARLRVQLDLGMLLRPGNPRPESDLSLHVCISTLAVKGGRCRCGL